MSHSGNSTTPGSWTLTGADGKPHASPVPGVLGGHRRTRIYGRLDCRAALRAIARGGYARHRVFFADAATAVAAGYRPCAACLPEQYAVWKAGQMGNPPRPAIESFKTLERAKGIEPSS